MYSSWWPAVLQRIEKTSNENYLWTLWFLFHYCLVVRWCSKEAFGVNRNGRGGTQAVIWGVRRPWPRRSDGTGWLIHQWLILWTHGKKQQSHTMNQGCKFEFKLEKSRLFCRTRKNSMSKRKRLSQKADLVFLSAWTRETWYFCRTWTWKN